MWPFSSSKHADSEEIIAMAAVIAKLKEENNSLKERAGRYWVTYSNQTTSNKLSKI